MLTEEQIKNILSSPINKSVITRSYILKFDADWTAAVERLKSSGADLGKWYLVGIDKKGGKVRGVYDRKRNLPGVPAGKA